jgi:hypothetical protein
MSRFFRRLLVVFSFVMMSSLAYGQGGGDSFIDLEDIKVEVKIELPRVSITKIRKQPEFDQVELEKDFKPELLSILKAITYTSITSGRVENVPDIEALATKPRQF